MFKIFFAPIGAQGVKTLSVEVYGARESQSKDLREKSLRTKILEKKSLRTKILE